MILSIVPRSTSPPDLDLIRCAAVRAREHPNEQRGDEAAPGLSASTFMYKFRFVTRSVSRDPDSLALSRGGT